MSPLLQLRPRPPVALSASAVSSQPRLGSVLAWPRSAGSALRRLARVLALQSPPESLRGVLRSALCAGLDRVRPSSDGHAHKLEYLQRALRSLPPEATLPATIRQC